jgi:hypothetical protein
MKCRDKKKFKTESEALAFLEDHRMQNMGVYECTCGSFHTYSKYHGKKK